MPSTRDAGRRKIRQRGFTLIEAMSAGAVLSILTLGLMGVWSAAGGAVNDLVVREKAIWTLNGQMERLVALYQFTDFGDGGADASSGYGYPAPYANTRLIYGQSLLDLLAPSGSLLGGLLGTEEGFGFLEEPTDFAGAEGYPVVLVSGLLPANQRNYVWIDRDRDIVGRLSWEESDLQVDLCDGNNQTGGSSPCLCLDFGGGSGGADCRQIMLTLEFPFRWDRDAAAPVAMPQDREILSLRTIVGRRL